MHTRPSKACKACKDHWLLRRTMAAYMLTTSLQQGIRPMHLTHKNGEVTAQVKGVVHADHAH